MIKKPLPYGKQEITEDDINSVIQVLKSDYLTQGPKIKEFEDAFATYVESKYAVAVSNGTSALHLSAIVLGVNRGDRVITTPITFSATANCVKYCGGDVDFADINPETYLIDIDKVRELLNASPMGTYSGIIPVDFTGYPVNLEDFRQLANEFDLWIIEDACHAPGGYFIDSNGKKQFCGNSEFADLSIFSFHPVKHIATGEGGMITTNSEEHYNKLLKLRTHGITKDPDLMAENHGGWYYEMQELGYNYRMADIQAALGLSQLKRIEDNLGKRRRIVERYDEAFEGYGIVNQKRSENYSNAYHLYVIEVNNRIELYSYLRSQQIMVQVHYIPVHLLPYYRKFGWNHGNFPVAEKYYERCLSLPMYPSLSDDQQEYVIDSITSFFK